MLTQVLGDHIPNISLIGPSISFWQPKQFPISVTMIKPHLLPHPLTHTRVVDNTHPDTWRTQTKFKPSSLVLQLAFGRPNNICVWL